MMMKLTLMISRGEPKLLETFVPSAPTAISPYPSFRFGKVDPNVYIFYYNPPFIKVKLRSKWSNILFIIIICHDYLMEQHTAWRTIGSRLSM